MAVGILCNRTTQAGRLALAWGALAACTAQPPSGDLQASLLGVTKSTFTQCSGPPQLSETVGNQERMSFLTNRTGGIGPFSAASAPVFACSSNAVFQNNRLVSVTFTGSPGGVCNDVFANCRDKGRLSGSSE